MDRGLGITNTCGVHANDGDFKSFSLLPGHKHHVFSFGWRGSENMCTLAIALLKPYPPHQSERSGWPLGAAREYMAVGKTEPSPPGPFTSNELCCMRKESTPCSLFSSEGWMSSG